MAFDAFYLTAVLGEVRERCDGAKVEKIYQPSRDTLIFQLRGQKSREKLLIAANPTAPRLHLTAASPENPPERPAPKKTPTGAAHVLHVPTQAPSGRPPVGNFPDPHGALRGVQLRLHR